MAASKMMGMFLFLFVFSLLIPAGNITGQEQTGPQPAPDLAEVLTGQMVVDTNHDDVADDIAARFLLDRESTLEDIEAAALIAARLGFETTAMDPMLAVSSWQEAVNQKAAWLILFSRYDKPPLSGEQKEGLTSKDDCGLRVYRYRGINVLLVFGASGQSRYYAARQFFSRFPYMWDVVGRETGEMWSKIKTQIAGQIPKELKAKSRVRLTAVHYRFKRQPHPAVITRRLQRQGLAGTRHLKGEVSRADVEVTVDGEIDKLVENLSQVRQDHQQGRSTHLFNYAGVGAVQVSINSGTSSARDFLFTRLAYSQRFLNRSYDPNYFKRKIKIKSTGADLANLFSLKGIYRDSDDDGFADRLVSRVIFDSTTTSGVVNLAARIGMAECAVSLPFFVPAREVTIDRIKGMELPILIGDKNPFVRYLKKVGKLDAIQPKANEGLIQFSEGFNPGGLYVISGANARGQRSALQYCTAILPHINSIEPGAMQWQDLSRQVGQFFTLNIDAGRACWAIARLDQQEEPLAAEDLEKAAIRLTTMRTGKLLTPFLARRYKKYLDKPGGKQAADLSVVHAGRLEGKEGFTDTFAPAWEVDQFRKIFTDQVLPRMKELQGQKNAGQDEKKRLLIDVRLSEPNSVIQQQAAWIRETLVQAGLVPGAFDIRVICAYKQGFHWLKDDVAKRLIPLRPTSIEIRFRPLMPQLNRVRKYWQEPVRWLQELYPVDEILSRDLKIPLKKITLVKDQKLSGGVYRIVAKDPTGKVVYREHFTPLVQEIPFQPRFPDWGTVTVATSGIRVVADGKEIFARQIDTDPMTLWKHYQNKILPRLVKMLEKQAGGALKMENQPFFDQLRVKVRMSEPDYRLNLDEEQISSLESFHEDLYLNTLDFFSGLVRKDPEMSIKDPLMSRRWAAPGNIIPMIYAGHQGKGPQMETQVTLLSATGTSVNLSLHFKGEEKPKETKTSIKALKLKAPRLTSIVVGEDGRAREAAFTVTFKNEAELSDGMDMLQILQQLITNNYYPDTFSVPGLTSLRFYLKSPGLRTGFRLRGLGGSQPAPAGQTGPFDRDSFQQALGRVLDPEETLKLSRSLASFAEIGCYIGGHSYQGRPVPVLEVGLEPGGSVVSQKKLITHKPTLFVLGRQHANEISSTNYALKLAWMLVNDLSYKKYLKQLNVVIEPMENPDGSALAVELQKLTPHHMLHAGRYSALGTDIGYHVNNANSLITEARVRKRIYDRWLPDVFLNDHGYPSHEWVQQFSNYTPYQFRAYWAPRGWYYFHRGLSSIGTPFHRSAGEEIVKLVAGKMKKDKELYAINQRIYNRYKRWAERWQPHIHYLEMVDGTNIYKARRGSRAAGLNKRRRLTVLEAIPEAMDETARGRWLQLAVRQGLLFVTAYMDLLLRAEKPMERIEEEYDDAVHIRIKRYRPVRVKNR